MRFFRQWHRTGRRKGTKGVFGGQILSQKQIQKLNERITAHEDAEFEDFEKAFDEHLKTL